MLLKLDENIGLKIDEKVILGKEKVLKYLNNNEWVLSGFNKTHHLNYHMDYGFNDSNHPVKIAYSDSLIQRIIVKTKDYANKRLKLLIAYDGSSYYGFQIQSDKPTIQSEVSKLISEVNNKEILVQGASRTDAQVHAYEQVLHFDDNSTLSCDEWLRFLNHRLPEDIYVKEIDLMHPLFHSRYDVYQKEYVYMIKLGEIDPFKVKYAWHQEYLDFIRLNDQLKKIIGRFDFTSFAKTTKSDNFRTIYDAGYKIEDDILKIYISGNGFLRYMVRLIVSHVVNYAIKKTDVDILEIIKEKSRKNTKDLAPASGLYLNKIIY